MNQDKDEMILFLNTLNTDNSRIGHRNRDIPIFLIFLFLILTFFFMPLSI